MKVKVYHSSYGCETGCCGHIVEIGDEQDTSFQFTHPSLGRENREAQKKEWATELAKEVIGQQWPECLPLIDWETIEYDEVLDD